QLGEDLKAKKWARAVEKIDAAAKKGDATEEQVIALLGAVREGIEPEIAAIATRSTGKDDAPAALRQVDQLIKTARWEIVGSGTEEIQADKALPEALAKKREALAIWAEAKRVGWSPIRKPEHRWAHGKVVLHPAANFDGPSKRDVPHGAEVWLL